MEYTPIPLSTQAFVLHEKSAAALSRAETELVRAEDRVLTSSNAQAVRKVLSRFEALMSSRVASGSKVELLSILHLEAAQQLYPTYDTTNELLERLMVREGLIGVRGLLEAFRYMQAIEWIGRTIKPNSVILPKTILNIHSRCLYGPVRRKGNVDFRANPYTFIKNSTVSTCYKAPDPENILALIEDYCAFINKDLLSPAAQAGISHFQIESIHPFEDSLDATERALSHMIFFRRGLLRSTIAPLALGPARDTEAHARYFLPYLAGHPLTNVNNYLNSGAIFNLCAYYTDVAARAINYFLDTVSSLEARWRTQVGKVGKNSTLDLLLHELPGMPLVTTSSAMKMVGKGFSATNEAISRLNKAGILQPATPIQKNHAFVAFEAIQAFEKINQKIIPRAPIARDDLLVT